MRAQVKGQGAGKSPHRGKHYIGSLPDEDEQDDEKEEHHEKEEDVSSPTTTKKKETKKGKIAFMKQKPRYTLCIVFPST